MEGGAKGAPHVPMRSRGPGGAWMNPKDDFCLNSAKVSAEIVPEVTGQSCHEAVWGKREANKDSR